MAVPEDVQGVLEIALKRIGDVLADTNVALEKLSENPDAGKYVCVLTPSLVDADEYLDEELGRRCAVHGFRIHGF